MILDFLRNNSLQELTAQNFCLYLNEQKIDSSNYFSLSKIDLFRLIFSDLETHIEIIKLDKSLNIHDKIFDFLMQLVDLYAIHKKTLQKVKSELNTCYYKECLYYGNRIAKRLETKLSLQSIALKNLPFIETLTLPKSLHTETLMGLCGYFLKIWLNDESADFEETMTFFDKALSYIEMR